MPKPQGTKQISSNRKAYHDYFVLENFEAGIELYGTEVAPRVRALLALVGRSVVVGLEPSTLKGRRAGNVLVASGVGFGSPSPLEYRVFTGRAVTDRFASRPRR